MTVRRALARLIPVLGAALTALALFAAPASAAGQHRGFLLLTVGKETTALPPGKAVRAAEQACAGAADAVVVSVDTVRAAFPNPVPVCTGVTLTSQVAAE